MDGNSDEKAVRAATSINEDRRGADYYQDRDVLADFLAGQFGADREKAGRVADAILADRQGADYYADEELLAQYLSGQFD